MQSSVEYRCKGIAFHRKLQIFKAISSFMDEKSKPTFTGRLAYFCLNDLYNYANH